MFSTSPHISLTDSIPEMERSAVYGISCGECLSIYIGQTRRKLEKRISEHRRYIKNNIDDDESIPVDLSLKSAVALWKRAYEPR